MVTLVDFDQDAAFNSSKRELFTVTNNKMWYQLPIAY